MHVKEKLTRIDNAIDKDIPWNQTVVILVHFSEQICQPRFLVIHEFQELHLEQKSISKMIMKCVKSLDGIRSSSDLFGTTYPFAPFIPTELTYTFNVLQVQQVIV